MRAKYYIQEDADQVRCLLCPHECLLKPDQTGLCKVRRNEKGALFSNNYGKVCSLHLDPIEKKPLYHFYPGKNILSVGTVGCNLHCRFCQNYEISQTTVKAYPYLKDYSPATIVSLATGEENNIGIAYTYNEPTVWYEFMYDIAEPAFHAGLKNVMVSNGFINEDPLKELLPIMHAFSIDLKAFTEAFYKHLTSSRLNPVLETLKTIRKSGRHLEITNLLIPDENDNEADFRNMMEWIRGELGEDTVLHISRFFPTYKLVHNATPEKLLLKFYDIAREYLNYVYLGNIHAEKGKDTDCPSCGNQLVKRKGYLTELTGMGNEVKCSSCGSVIPITN